MKIGRNERCPCGSGKKYKHCCDRLQATGPQSIPPEIMQKIRIHEAAERVRTQQQGHGRGIISFEQNGYRIVAVRNRVLWSKEWFVFTDFLIHHMKDVLNLQWGQRESQRQNNPHPLFRWLQKFQAYKTAHSGTGRVRSGNMMGFVACPMYLAYSLYLIAHHDELPKRLLKRLRNPKTFLPAYYETMAGAAFALAGFEIRCEETKNTSDPTPEYTVTSKTSHKAYKLEAKRKDGWTAVTQDINDPTFRNELVGYLRDKLYAASAKKLPNAIYWIELSIPSLTSKDAWRDIVSLIKDTLRDAEKTLKINGAPAVPAYVFVTNHTYLANEDIAGNPGFASLETFNMADFIPHGLVDIEDALSGYDRHRDIFWAFDCLNIASTIPATFDGTPAELLDKDGRPLPALKIGDRVKSVDEAGQEWTGIIEEIACDESHDAWGVIRDEKTNAQSIIKLPLTEAEKQASGKYGEAVFGKPNVSSRLAENDLFGLYNWLLKTFIPATREQSLEQLKHHPLYKEYEKLSDEDLRRRICRERVKSLYAMRQNTQPPPVIAMEPA